jgi:hypothetical protein
MDCFVCTFLSATSHPVNYQNNDWVAVPPWADNTQFCPVASCMRLAGLDKSAVCGSCGAQLCVAHFEQAFHPASFPICSILPAFVYS